MFREEGDKRMFGPNWKDFFKKIREYALELTGTLIVLAILARHLYEILATVLGSAGTLIFFLACAVFIGFALGQSRSGM